MLFSLSSVPGCASPGPSHASLTMTAVLWPLAKALPPVHTRRCGWVSALAPRPHLGQGLNGASGPWKEQLPEPLDSRTFRFLQIGLLVGTPGSVSSLGSCVCCGTTLGKVPHLSPVHTAQGSCLPHLLRFSTLAVFIIYPILPYMVDYLNLIPYAFTFSCQIEEVNKERLSEFGKERL